MLLPPDFLDQLDEDSQHGFLDSLVLGSCGADAYSGDLSRDRKSLLQRIRRAEVRVEFSEEEETFRLLTQEQAKQRGA